jgi:hypothetical protein
MISLISDFFSFTFYNKFDKTYQFFPCKKALNVKKARFFPIFFLNYAFYGLDTGPKQEPEP